jgi:hypothetical protein
MIQAGDKIKLVTDLNPAKAGETGTVERIEEGKQWPVVAYLDGRLAEGEYYLALHEVEAIEPVPDPLELDRIRLIRVEKKLDRLLWRLLGEKYDESTGIFKKG